MHTFNFPPAFINRFQEYLGSKDYKKVSDFAKSEYWQFHSDQIDITIVDNDILVRGNSGYYIPTSKNRSLQFSGKIRKAFENPALILPFLKRRISPMGADVKLLNYFEAFDAVMSCASIADIEMHPHRINFTELNNNSNVIHSIEEITENFFPHKYNVNPSVVYFYYLYNILMGYSKASNFKTVLDIGAGNGNFVSILRHNLNTRIIIVDLPETLSLSMIFLEDLFPSLKKLMPHEVNVDNIDKADIVFLTPSQIDLVKEDSVDLISNTFSFQEMTKKQIEEYFNFIQKAVKNEGYFVTSNRVEKIPTYFDDKNPTKYQQTKETVNRFHQYPWNPNNEVIINEICRFFRLVQLDDVYIHLEKIKK